jgi:hypothetical protein
VFDLAGRTAGDGAASGRDDVRAEAATDPRSCIDVTTALREVDGEDHSPAAPWGVQLAGNFSKAMALASFERARQRYFHIVGDLQPTIIDTRPRSRGTRRFYPVLLPAASRAAADQVCRAIIGPGGACAALRS